MLRYQSNKTQ